LNFKFGHDVRDTTYVHNYTLWYVVIVTVRFEEEILTSQKIGDVHGNNSADSKVIIGSSTFDQVQAQLNNQLSHPPLEAAEVTTAAQKPENSTVKPRLTFSGVDHSCVHRHQLLFLRTGVNSEGKGLRRGR